MSKKKNVKRKEMSRDEKVMSLLERLVVAQEKQVIILEKYDRMLPIIMLAIDNSVKKMKHK